ncbi:DUF1392 family protein [Nostoc sp. C057]|uniref:DUF1392 family protein n=1 Tax=Nostoc sp. C057 TaxID=2576903 RepID=UPI00277B5BD4|nr:DUF1392 family protein [Nostoc sp. C057]
MINLVQTLETCWYVSPPWGKEIPPLEVSLLEKVYVTTHYHQIFRLLLRCRVAKEAVVVNVSNAKLATAPLNTVLTPVLMFIFLLSIILLS